MQIAMNAPHETRRTPLLEHRLQRLQCRFRQRIELRDFPGIEWWSKQRFVLVDHGRDSRSAAEIRLPFGILMKGREPLAHFPHEARVEPSVFAPGLQKIVLLEA